MFPKVATVKPAAAPTSFTNNIVRGKKREDIYIYIYIYIYMYISKEKHKQDITALLLKYEGECIYNSFRPACGASVRAYP